MAVYDIYEIAIKYKNQSFQLSPKDFTFSLRDSIYTFYNWGTITFNDYLAIIGESYLNTEGLSLTIDFGTSDGTIITCNYDIVNDELNDIKSKATLGGKLTLKLVNSYYNQQTIRSAAYKDRISNIIRNRISEYFSDNQIDINDTGNQDIWYQPLITDEEFIRDVLTPNAFSNNAEKTPFYAFITSDNIFHFRNYKSLIDPSNKIQKTIKYNAPSQREFDDNKVLQIRRWRDGSDKSKNQRHRYIFRISSEDGTLIESENFIYDYPSLPNTILPIIGDDSLITSYLNLGYSEDTIGRQENLKGNEYSTAKKGISLDKFMILLPLDTNLVSGKKVYLEVHTNSTSGQDSKLSRVYSGEYLIEESDHIWEGENFNGYSRLVLSRKYLPDNNNILIKDEFYNI